MKVIILAGGSGQRLWPLSRATHPKQFLDFGDGETLLQKTVKRFHADDVLIVTSNEYYHLIRNQVGDVDILIEPERKNTGPAIVFALNHLLEKGKVEEHETVLVTPSDHVIEPQEVFLEAITLARGAAHLGALVTFGIKPLKPETGYGYIRCKGGSGSVRDVEDFVEKPSIELAEEYFADPTYFWNSGIFVFEVKTFLEELAIFAPDLLVDFADSPSISIDYALFEKTSRLKMVPLSAKWSDVGSWDSLYSLLNKDDDHNVKIGNVHDVDTKNCLILGGKRLISTIGVEDLVIVETDDAVFIGKKGESQRVKHLVEKLAKKGMKESHTHPTIHRPWGHFTVLEEGRGYKIKKIVVNPMGKLSLQRHKHRSEHWVVVEGKARVRMEEKEFFLEKNESVFVSAMVKHRLKNPFETPLEIIEVQVGSYLGEDDIERFEDIYGRDLATDPALALT